MSLQDRFKRKTTTIQSSEAGKRVAASTPLAGAPKSADLNYSMDKAQKEIGRPVILSWKSADRHLTYLLTITGGKGVDPTWMMHSGTEEESNSLWIYQTNDTELISTLILTAIKDEDQPKGHIPEHLRPQNEIALRKEDTQDLPSVKEGEAPLPVEEFADKYDLIARLGHGGMGMIYKARNKSNRRMVALKVLHSHLLTDTESKKRFEHEAANCKTLNHRNCITLHEYGFSKHGQPYMAMEYVNGRPLAGFLVENTRLELPVFINVFTQICDGLQHAHEQGVVHRDVKPSNIMILKTENAGKDQIKIVDFGIAKSHLEKNREQLTPTGNVLGSPAYIAPEQCAGSDPDPRSDIYSLGCVMYEAITGRPPFHHENAIKVLLMQLSEPPPPFASVVPHLQLPEDLEAIILKCLEKDPKERYQTAEELAVDLWTFAATGRSDMIHSSASLADHGTAGGDNGGGGESGASSSESEKVLENEGESDREGSGRGEPASQSDSGEAAQPKSDGEPVAAGAADPVQAYGTIDGVAEMLGGFAGGFANQPRFSAQFTRPMESPGAQTQQQQQQQQQKPSGQFTRPSGQYVRPAEGDWPIKPAMTLRFRRFRSPSEMDVVWEGLNIARNIQKKGVPLTLFLDLETSCLVHKPDLIASRLQYDQPTMKKLTAIQSLLQSLIRGGAAVVASERWVKMWSESGAIMPGVVLIGEEEIAALFIERIGSILDY